MIIPDYLLATDLTIELAAGTIHQISRTVAGITPPGGSTISDIVQFRILRDTTNASGEFGGADTYPPCRGCVVF